MASAQVALLTRLPTGPDNSPVVPSGVVQLFQDPDWNSNKLELDITEFTPGERQQVTESMFDQASIAAFNLPVGVVMTLMDNVVPVDSGKIPADLSNCGRTVDFVGTGQTETVDIMALGMNDSISSFFWRTVDLTMGAIELFDNANFEANRVTLFLSEWSSGHIWPLTDWWIQDRTTSVRWTSLMDRQTASLYDNPDGTGNSFNNIKGFGSIKEANLGPIGMNDNVSAFKWESVVPVKEIVAPFDIPSASIVGGFGLTDVSQGRNDSDSAQSRTVSINDSDSQTVTTTVVDQLVTGVSTTIGMESTEGVAGVASTKESFSVTMSFQYTHSTTMTNTETKTIALNISQTVNIPPRCTYKATLLVTIGQLPPTVFTTTAQRWYTLPITGAVPDPVNNGWFKRIETVTLSMSGSLASSSVTDMHTEKL